MVTDFPPKRWPIRLSDLPILLAEFVISVHSILRVKRSTPRVPDARFTNTTDRRDQPSLSPERDLTLLVNRITGSVSTRAKSTKQCSSAQLGVLLKNGTNAVKYVRASAFFVGH